MEDKIKSKPPMDQKSFKVCVVGVFDNNHSSSIFFADGFQQVESVLEVVRFDYRRILKRDRKNIVQKMVDISKKVDIMVICKGNGIPTQAIKLCSKNCRILFWMMDVYSHFNRGRQLLENSIYCDYRTATGHGTVDIWSKNIKLPVYHIMDGSDTSTYYPMGIAKQYDVTFIGANDKERETIYEFLKKQKINVEFFGPQFTNFVYPTEFRDICNRSKIVLNISRGKYEGYSSLRLWNLLACGTMVLTKTIPKMTEYMKLEEGIHIVSFKNLVDIASKVRYYINHEDERLQIGDSGLKFLKNNRTWKHSAKNIIELIKTQPSTYMVDNYVYPYKPPKKRTPKSITSSIHKKRRIEKLKKKIPNRPKPPGVTRKVKNGWITV